MPELPEVETIRRGLEEFLIGKKITDVNAIWHKSMPVEKKDIADKIIDSRIDSFSRRGKVMIVGLDNGYSLLVHLKMTGQLILDAATDGQIPTQRISGGHPTGSIAAELPDNSTRVIFSFDCGSRLFFNDQRKFGWIKLVRSSAIEQEELLKNMGPEPLSNEFTSLELKSRLRRSRRVIKAVILDQSVVAGIGNIYADEALHLAKINPFRTANELTVAEIERLHRAIKQIIGESLRYGGTSFSSYVDTEGKKGDYLDNARVFQRQGQACPECGYEITKTKVAGRGTHVCLHCQRP